MFAAWKMRTAVLRTAVLLSWFCLWTRSQRLDPDSWSDRAVMTSDGLCRYGNSVECCWGWRPTDRGRCQPDCQQGCKHGDCVGPDRCKCRPGYTGKACNHDLNECGLKPRPCKHRCMNTAGSYKCYCLDGFTLQEDGSCRNARTCYHANCQYGCEVIKGAVRCTCPSPGLRLGPDGRTCIDVDECLSGRFVCARRRKCVNTFGSYTCRCHLGFRLMFIDGRYSCIDKDTRTFCSLNPSSPKCRCKDGSCRDVPKVSLEPQKPRTTTPTTTTTTTPTTTTTTTTTSTTTTARPTTTTTVLTTTTTLATTIPATTDAATTKTTTSIPTTTTTTTITTSIPVTTTATTTPVTTTTTTPTTPPPTTTISTSIPNTLVTTTELDTTTPTIPPPPPPPTTTPTTTTTTTATTPSTTPLPTITTTTTPTTPPSTTPPPTTTVTTVTTVAPVTTTISNRIINDVTHKQRGDVHIPRHPGHNQVWEFDIELGNTADDARDDPDVGVLHCSFDGGVCGWMSDGDGDLDWETVDNPAVGRYLSVPELKAGQRSIRGARLAVQIAPTWRHGDLCFSFSHWLTGHHVGVLQLFVRKTGRDQRYGSALWSRTGGHGWRHTQVTLTTQSVDMVLLKAERRIGRRGQIAIDDVTLRRGACR